MNLQITVHDGVSEKLTQAVSDLRSGELMKNLGDAAAAVATRAFREESLRPSPWAPRKPPTGDWPLLRHTLLLERSIRVTECDANHAVIGSDRLYAAFQQFGTRKGLPARPFMPFDSAGNPTPAVVERLEMRAEVYLKKLADGFNR